MLEKKNYQFWFCTGSQDLYGEECLAHVAEHSKIIVEALNRSGNLPYEVIWKPTMITNEVIRRTFNEANTDANCAGIITCIRFLRQNHGSWAYRNCANHFCIYIPSSTGRSHMTPSIWTL